MPPKVCYLAEVRGILDLSLPLLLILKAQFENLAHFTVESGRPSLEKLAWVGKPGPVLRAGL